MHIYPEKNMQCKIRISSSSSSFFIVVVVVLLDREKKRGADMNSLL